MLYGYFKLLKFDSSRFFNILKLKIINVLSYSKSKQKNNEPMKQISTYSRYIFIFYIIVSMRP